MGHIRDKILREQLEMLLGKYYYLTNDQISSIFLFTIKLHYTCTLDITSLNKTKINSQAANYTVSSAYCTLVHIVLLFFLHVLHQLTLFLYLHFYVVSDNFFVIAW